MPIVEETDDAYHAGEGVSKTKLWKLWDKTPYHAMFGKKKESPEFDLGKAAHIAILEPETMDARVTRGPDDRRGNKWKEAQDFADHAGTILLTAGDYDMAQVIRDVAGTCEALDIMRDGQPIVETSAYHVDEETGILTKCRPDIVNPTHKLIGDIKNMASGSTDDFIRSVGKFGYHVQEAMYSDVWEKGASMPVEGFFFICFEKSDPPLVSVFELDAPTVAEGHAIYRAALKRYADCVFNNTWPGYPQEVQKIGLKKWDYKLTPAPEDAA
jgi:hypothetical protein